MSNAKHFDPGVKTVDTKIRRRGSVHRDSQPDKIILPTKKSTREDASTDIYREPVSRRKQRRHQGKIHFFARGVAIALR